MSIGTREPFATQAQGSCAAAVPEHHAKAAATSLAEANILRPAAALSAQPSHHASNTGTCESTVGKCSLGRGAEPVASPRRSDRMLSARVCRSVDLGRLNAQNTRPGRAKSLGSGRALSSSHRLHSVSTVRSIHKKSCSAFPLHWDPSLR